MSKNNKPQPVRPQRAPRLIGSETAPVLYFDGSHIFGTMHGSIIQADIGVTITVPLDDGVNVRTEIKVVAQMRGTEKAWKSLFDSVLGGKKLLQEERERMRNAKKPEPARSVPEVPQETDKAA
jgi:hypothetical protein